MNVQFLLKEKTMKTSVVIPMNVWKKIQNRLKPRSSDFWETLPEHVRESIGRGQKQAAAEQVTSNEEVMQKYAKYL